MFDVSKVDPFSLPSIPLAERDRLPRDCAIYFVLNAAADVLYIGKARCLHYRWKKHHKLDLFQALGQIRIAWITFDPPLPKEEMFQVERECIWRFHPPVNNNGKRSLPLHLRTAYRKRHREELYRKNTISWGWSDTYYIEAQKGR